MCLKQNRSVKRCDIGLVWELPAPGDGLLPSIINHRSGVPPPPPGPTLPLLPSYVRWTSCVSEYQDKLDHRTGHYKQVTKTQNETGNVVDIGWPYFGSIDKWESLNTITKNHCAKIISSENELFTVPYFLVRSRSSVYKNCNGHPSWV